MSNVFEVVRESAPKLSVADLVGEDYLHILQRIHATLSPKSYFEIGTHGGDSLLLARCASIAVDPNFQLGARNVIEAKPLCALYQVTSDAFFETIDPTLVFGRKIDFAFLDGMHRCEFLLRDFTNTERFCRPNSIIALHDCLPVEQPMAERNWIDARVEPHRIGWWAGDVWRTALLLKRRRPDLRIHTIAAPPTGLVLITNLDPASRALTQNYNRLVDEMLAMRLDEIGIDRLHEEMQPQPQSALDSEEKITARFWL